MSSASTPIRVADVPSVMSSNVNDEKKPKSNAAVLAVQEQARGVIVEEKSAKYMMPMPTFASPLDDMDVEISVAQLTDEGQAPSLQGVEPLIFGAGTLGWEMNPVPSLQPDTQTSSVANASNVEVPESNSAAQDDSSEKDVGV